MTPQLLTAAQAARYLGVGPNRLRAWVRAGAVPFWTDPVTGRRLYSRLALDEWARQLDDREVAS